MIRLQYSVELNYQVQGPGADFILIIQAAQTRYQHVVDEQLGIGQTLMPLAFTDPVTKTRYLRL